jgi:integrase
MSLWQTRDGLWRMRYYAAGSKRGRRVQESLPKGTTAAEARREYRIRLGKAARRQAGPLVSLTFGEAADEYLATQGPKMSEAGRERAESILEKHLNPAFGERRVDSLTQADLERYQNERRAKPNTTSPATVNREMNVFRAVLNKAEAWGLIERNPIRRGALSPLEAPKGKTVFFEAEEWSRFIRAFEDGERWKAHVAKVRHLGPKRIGAASPAERIYGGGRQSDSEATGKYLARLRRTVPVFQMLLYTGCRLGEVIGLRWEDVDLERSQLSILQEKTSKRKHVPVSGALLRLLKAIPKGTPAAYVFTRQDGSPFARIDIQRAFAVARKMTGLREELTVHSLRHTFASWLAIQGTPLRTIAELLGHADIRMTLRYAHLSPAHLREAVEAVEAVEKSSRRHSGATSAVGGA